MNPKKQALMAALMKGLYALPFILIIWFLATLMSEEPGSGKATYSQFMIAFGLGGLLLLILIMFNEYKRSLNNKNGSALTNSSISSRWKIASILIAIAITALILVGSL